MASRREALRWMGAASLAGFGAAGWGAAGVAAPARTAAGAAAPAGVVSAEQDVFLDELERRGCQFFFDQASATTGQVRDRARAEGSETRRVASVAATGFGLSALCVADKRGYLPAAEVRSRVRTTLDWHLRVPKQEHGFFYHFMDLETGERLWRCEASSIDTSIFLCGALLCRAYFLGAGVEKEIRDLATALYERVEWPWMLYGLPEGAPAQAPPMTYSMGWKPESGFLKARWSTYSELMMIYLLGIGSPTHGVDVRTWQAFARPYVEFEGFRYISDVAPLFTHQYSHAWFDFRGRHDRYADYFANSIVATRAHKAFCLSLGMGYSDDYWGITASDSEHGYTAWGGPPVMGKIDGSVVPCAAAGSLAFVPQDCLRVLMSLRQKYPKAWGRYGFVDAFHARDGWYDADVLGIDQGIGVLMAENLRTGFAWETFMKNAEVGKAMGMVGLVRRG